MDLSFFHAHGSKARGRQRGVNIDGWLLPSIGAMPPTVTIRYRDPDDGLIKSDIRRFGKEQKNFRLHGSMVRGDGFAAFGSGDLMLLHFTGATVTWTLLRNQGAEQALFRFLSDLGRVTWKRNMGVVRDARQIQGLEALLTKFDAQLFFESQLEGLDEEPQAATLRRALRRVVTPEEFQALQEKWRRNGELGELFVMKREHDRLVALGREDLARRLEHVARTDPTSPFDIKSFEGTKPDPEAVRYIEVKATSRDGMEFEMSDAEWVFAEDKRHQHFVFRVTGVAGPSPECREFRDIVGYFLSDAAVRRPIAFKVRIV